MKNFSASTSTRVTKEAIIMAKASPASNNGAPHWNGHGTRILQNKGKRVSKSIKDDGFLHRYKLSKSHGVVLMCSYHGAELMSPERSVLQLI